MRQRRSAANCSPSAAPRVGASPRLRVFSGATSRGSSPWARVQIAGAVRRPEAGERRRIEVRRVGDATPVAQREFCGLPGARCRLPLSRWGWEFRTGRGSQARSAWSCRLSSSDRTCLPRAKALTAQLERPDRGPAACVVGSLKRPRMARAQRGPRSIGEDTIAAYFAGSRCLAVYFSPRAESAASKCRR